MDASQISCYERNLERNFETLRTVRHVALRETVNDISA